MTDEELLKKVNFLMNMMSNPLVSFSIRSSIRKRFEESIDDMVEKAVTDVSYSIGCSTCAENSALKCFCCTYDNGRKNYKPSKKHIEDVIEAHDKHKQKKKS